MAKDPPVFDFIGLTKEVADLAVEAITQRRLMKKFPPWTPGWNFRLLLVRVPTNRSVLVEFNTKQSQSRTQPMFATSEVRRVQAGGSRTPEFLRGGSQ